MHEESTTFYLKYRATLLIHNVIIFTRWIVKKGIIMKTSQLNNSQRAFRLKKTQKLLKNNPTHENQEICWEQNMTTGQRYGFRCMLVYNIFTSGKGLVYNVLTAKSIAHYCGNGIPYRLSL